MTTMKRAISLSNLCGHLIPQATSHEILISALALDSRKVKPGSLFFAYPGTETDGRLYIDNALQQGAVAILYEDNEAFQLSISSEYKQIPCIPVQNLANLVGLVAARFYDNPGQKMRIFGITGTSGKSSCSLFLAAALHDVQRPAGVLGTIGNGIYGAMQESSHTTLDAITLQQTLAKLRQQGVKNIAMEVSSHALHQGRVNGLQFDTAIFTNLSHEHLDYHGDFINYAAAKRRLFNFPNLQTAVINADDPYGLHWLQELTGKLPVYGYSLDSDLAKASSFPCVYAQQIRLSSQGITANINTPWGVGILHAKQLGCFNLSNLLAVLTALLARGMPLEQALAKLANLPQVPGRMESFGGGVLPTVIVDYAHKPEALKQVLITLRSICMGKLWCVFGCGGNRDKAKRPIMGRLAEQLADYVIVTDDNPRHEEAKQIIAEILQGMETPHVAVIEHDRARAIAHAISCAEPQDIVLVAGKGHEGYQLIGGEKILFSDALTVQRLLAQKQKSGE
jgi:UDP-N-acetylmuramoyl-L-alanyl-D-glutamate--2,6-diaminopimelate ligase